MTLSSDVEAGLVALLRRAAHEHVLPRFRALADGETRAKTSLDDLVTEADLASERTIAAGAARLLPGALIVGEEAVSADPGLPLGIPDADVAVIIDPIDGTWNFAHGLATFGMILAVTQAGETVFGLLYDPIMDDMVLARKGGGAWMVRPGKPPRRLTLERGAGTPEEAAGFVPLFLFDGAPQERLAALVPEFRRAWTVRCSCHEYRLMAQGSADFCLTGTLNPWDHAAGVLAVTEAGGAASLIDGSPYRPGPLAGQMIVARSEGLLERLRARIAPIL